MAFLPKPDETVDFKGRTFRFVQHRAAKDSMVHAETGARATVFLAMQGADPWALKVFRPKFRKPHQAEVVSRLVGLRGMPGLRVAERDVVLPDDPLARAHRDLAFAQLMPWVGGVPWANILTFGVQKNHCYLDPAHAFELCRRFLWTMRELESRTVAHTDIASGNVLVDPDTLSVELIDLEEMYGPGFPEPGQKNVGSAGYTHPSGVGLWFAEADRFAVTILAAEMLVLAHPQLAQGADTGGGYFDNTEFGQRSARFAAAHDYFSNVVPDFAEVFARAWTSSSVHACPRAADLLEAFSRSVSSVPKPAGPALVPVHQPATWTPPVVTRRSSSQPSQSTPPATHSTPPATHSTPPSWSSPPATSSSPPATSSSPPATPVDVVMGWNRLGTPGPSSEPPRAGVRRPVQLNRAQVVATVPSTPAPAPAPTPHAPPLFAYGELRVRPDGAWNGMAFIPSHELRGATVERIVGPRDYAMAVIVAASGTACVWFGYVWQPQLMVLAGIFVFVVGGSYLSGGIGQPTLVIHGTAGRRWEIPMESQAVAEVAARTVRGTMGPHGV